MARGYIVEGVGVPGHKPAPGAARFAVGVLPHPCRRPTLVYCAEVSLVSRPELGQRSLRRTRAWFGRACLGLGVLIWAAFTACAGGPVVETPPPGAAGEAGAAPEAPSLSFERGSSTLVPRETRTFTVVVKPPGAYEVLFSLLPGEESAGSLDASLDRGRAISDALGRVSVALTAPSARSNLVLRAAVEGATAELPISVIPGGLASLEVTPLYNGPRVVRTWRASAFLGKSCEELSFPYTEPPDFSVSARGNEPTQQPQLPATSLVLGDVAVPEDERLALTVHGDDLVAGCRSVIRPPIGEVSTVSVAVTDRPLDLALLGLYLGLSIAPNDVSMKDELVAATLEMVSALHGSADTEAAALLDALRGVLDSNRLRTAFDSARESGDWDGLIEQRFGGGEPIVAAVERWTQLARLGLLSSRAFELELAAADAAGTTPALTLLRVAGVSAEPTSAAVTGLAWHLDVGDVLSFSAELSWSRTALLAELARPVAMAETSGSSVPEALALVVGCADLAELSSRGTTEAETDFSAACDAECWQAACEGALDLIWQRAQGFSANAPSELTLVAVGDLGTGPDAAVQSIDGLWAGKLTHAKTTVQSEGSLLGQAKPR